MSKTLLLLLTVTILFAVSSCKLSGDKDNNNEINNGGNGDKFSTDALWDNGSTVNFYSSAELYSDIDGSGLFPALQNDAGIRARWYENQLKGISTYGGQQLEIDWKTDTRKLCDITFRALLTNSKSTLKAQQVMVMRLQPRQSRTTTPTET